MATTFKRSVARGFTLIELLIVVIILAILAAIAIPQFSASTSDAQLAALDANLSTVRTALEQYKVQHTGNVYPGAVASTATGTCPGGGNSTAAAIGSDAMAAQLTGYTNAAGQVCPTGDTNNFKYGPYLRQGIPTEPFSAVKTVDVVTTGAAVAASKGTGWAYSTATGQFIAKNSDTDGTTANRKYSDH